MSNTPSWAKPLRGGIYQERYGRKRKRRQLAAAKHSFYRKNPPMDALAPLPEPKTRKRGIGEQLHVRRRLWLGTLALRAWSRRKGRPKVAA